MFQNEPECKHVWIPSVVNVIPSKDVVVANFNCCKCLAHRDVTLPRRLVANLMADAADKIGGA